MNSLPPLTKPSDETEDFGLFLSVCICTYKRPMVAATIQSVHAQLAISNVRIEIIVCDDDSEASAQDTVRNIARESAVPIFYVISASRNIATCRNVCMNAATGDWIAFIDDDETAEPNWLSELLLAQARFGADVVKGNVKGVYPPDTANWLVAVDPFTRDFGPTGTRLDTVPTNGVLFRRAIAGESQIQFDPRYGRSGGEDVDFFRRLSARGAVIISCRTAVVHEHVESGRLEKKYLQHRYRITGRVHCISYIMFLPAKAFYLQIGRSALIVLATSFYPAVMLLTRSMGFRMFIRFWAHIGIIEAVLGRDLDLTTDREPEMKFM